MSHLCMSHQVDLLVCKKIKFTLIQTPSLSFMCVLLRRLGQSVGWDMNLPSMISPHSTKSCIPSRVCCSNMGICAPIPPFPTQRVIFRFLRFLCCSLWEQLVNREERINFKTSASGLRCQFTAPGTEQLRKDSSEKHVWEIQTGSKTHAVSIWSTNVIHEKGWRNRGFT